MKREKTSHHRHGNSSVCPMRSISILPDQAHHAQPPSRHRTSTTRCFRRSLRSCAEKRQQKRPSLQMTCFVIWSGWRDSNSRPLAPHASALPGCATPRTEKRSISRLLQKSNSPKEKNFTFFIPPCQQLPPQLQLPAPCRGSDWR